MYARFAERRAREALSDTPVVLIVGPRRAGKTTLVRSIEPERRTYVTLDDPTALEAAQADPVNFVRRLTYATIDEVQRAPDLLLAIKKSVDEDKQPGRFLLTGSANVLTIPRVADSLAGRMETIEMLPLAQAEIEGSAPTFLERLFDNGLKAPATTILGDDLMQLVLRGGFPEAVERDNERRRQAWMSSYLNAVLVRDLRDIAQIDRLTDLPRFVRLLARYAGQLVNYSQIGSSVGVAHRTAQRYVSLLEQVFLVTTLPPWHANEIKRLARTPKLHFLDSGLLAANRGVTFERLKSDRTEYGALLESFVFSELRKLMTASELRLAPCHFRERELHEVDIVLERDDRTIAGIEVKANATVKAGDFGGLRRLAEITGSRFAAGVVLYDGDSIIAFGDRLAAVPVSCLWH